MAGLEAARCTDQESLTAKPSDQSISFLTTNKRTTSIHPTLLIPCVTLLID